jgi:7-cyano-7-deazaguanine synthase
MKISDRTSSERNAVGVTIEEAPATLADAEKWRARVDERKGAVALVSGGLDSATVLALARSTGTDCHALTVDYGQRHRIEIEAARRVAVQLGAASHRVVTVDLRVFGGSALTDEIAVPNPENADTIGRTIPATYVPARNTIFLSLALAWAEVLEITDIYIGATARDFSGYPDCRPEFLRAFEHLANLATRAGTEKRRQFQVHAPLLNWTKDKIIRRGVELGVNFGITHSCYDPSSEGLACGLCDSCIIRRRGFEAAGVDDPTKYAESE